MSDVNLSKTVDTYCKNIRNEVERTRKKTGVNNGIRDYPAVAVVAADRGLTFSGKGRSCKVQYREYDDTPKLKNKLQSLGVIGKKRRECENIIGACAEPHAAHRVLRHFGQSMNLSQLVFSVAYRPRTMEKIEYCDNCKLTFPTI